MITVRQLGKRFGDLVVLTDLNLDIPDAQISVLMGPSGVGKTTLAQILLGLLRPDTGKVAGLAGRRASAVFQEDRLCEHLSAVANVRLVLDRGTGLARVRSELARVGLDEQSCNKPVSELSGGQRRRVALVRAMLADSDFVCLDEPFTGLDNQTRTQAIAWIRQQGRGRTLLVITHDLSDAAELGGTQIVLQRPPEADQRRNGA